jgi:hypothetical protein
MTILTPTLPTATPPAGAVTIHQLDRSAFDSDREYKFTKDDIRRGERAVSLADIDTLYRPVESIVGTTDIEAAYHRAQGHVVNREQRARHGVPSASPTDVFEVIEDDGTRSFHIVEGMGFSEIDLKPKQNSQRE